MTGTIDDTSPSGAGPSAARSGTLTERTVEAARRNRLDLLLVVLVAAAGALMAFVVQRRTGRAAWQQNDFWFDMDTHRVGLQMTTRDMVSPLNTNLHPGFILFTNVPLSLLVPLSDVQKLTVEVCAFCAAVDRGVLRRPAVPRAPAVRRPALHGDRGRQRHLAVPRAGSGELHRRDGRARDHAGGGRAGTRTAGWRPRPTSLRGSSRWVSP